jgi:lysophospholipase L1-like esterase
MKKTNQILVAVASSVLVLLGGCEINTPGTPTTEFSAEETETLRTASIGDSQTAGFMAGALHAHGQAAGFANQVARSVFQSGNPAATTTTGAPGIFMQMPLMTYDPDNGDRGIGRSEGVPSGALYVTSAGSISADALTVDPLTLLENATYPLPYDNLGVPGSTTADALATTDASNSQLPDNSFFDLILRNSELPPGNAPQMVQFESLAMRQTIVDPVGPVYETRLPELLTVWVGNNDILGGATSGDPVLGGNLTPASVFATLLDGILDRVDAMGVTKVALANIPDITSLPFFTTVPLSSGGMPYNTDETGVEFILLPAPFVSNPSVEADYLPGGGESLSSDLTLTAAEAAVVAGLIDEYNSIIADEANSRAYALVDANSLLAGLAQAPMDPDFGNINGLFPWGPGGQNAASAFSLDGVHPSEKGYAYVANAFLLTLNNAYGTSYPQVDWQAVDNVAGFEEAPTSSKRAQYPSFTEAGLRALSGSIKAFEPRGAN